MTAGLRIYDPDTGLVTLDTTDGLSRIVHVVEDETTTGSVTIPNAIIDGGTLFWYGIDQAGWNNSTFATISGNTVTYEKQAGYKIMIGVYT